MSLTESMAFTTGVPDRDRALPPRETMSGIGLATTAKLSPQEWMQDVRVQIKELLLLDDAWDGSAAAPISGAAVEAAIRFVTVSVDEVAGLQRPYVSPTANGGVNLEWHGADAHFDVTFEDDVWVYASSPSVDWEGSVTEIPTDAVSVLLSHFVDH